MTFTPRYLNQLKAARVSPNGAAPGLPLAAEAVTRLDNLAPLPSLRARPLDPFTLGAMPGHCASCERWTADGWGFMGNCRAGRAAHGWLDGARLAVVSTSAHMGCQAYGGKGWQARRGVV